MSDLDHNSKVGTSTDMLSQRRRALIKGSAVAIPAILTLRSGSALAAASLTCVQKTPTKFHPVAVSINPDGWHRAQTLCRTLTRTVNGTQEKKTTTTLHVYKDPTDTTTTDPKWFSVLTDNHNHNHNLTFYKDKKEESKKMTEHLNGNSGNDYDISVGDSPCYVLVQVNADGNPTGVVGAPDTSTFLFASDSCYDSLHP